MIAPVVERALEWRIKAQAFGLGFDLAGIARLGPVETADAFDAWVARGYAGDMEYLPRWSDKRHCSPSPSGNEKSGAGSLIFICRSKPRGYSSPHQFLHPC